MWNTILILTVKLSLPRHHPLPPKLLAVVALQNLATVRVVARGVTSRADSKVDIVLTSNLELLGKVLGVVLVSPETGTAGTVVPASTSRGAARGDVAEVLYRVERVARVGAQSVESVASVVTSRAAGVGRRATS